MTTILHRPARIVAKGPFDLGASARFLAGFTPAARPDAGDEAGTLRLAFPVEGTWEHAGVLVRQRAPGSVEVSVEAGQRVAGEAVRQVRRILSLDVDGSGFAAVGEADPVVGRLLERYPGLRPVLFPSPYEAACWAIIGNQLRMASAAQLKRRLAERNGVSVEVSGHRLASFPAPAELLALDRLLDLPEVKVRRLHSIARAALDGVLDAAALRAMDPGEALYRLQKLPGVGPFSAQLILIRGAGHPDVFPTAEERLHAEMRALYRRPEAKVTELERIARGWRPYRSWVALLLRTNREARSAS
ncbi:DNA-3-methyladenine glycosylase 2 family protein [Amycolatopsis rhizosphaerae]|uniref:DNA-3-methyladenine glycosylase II n=1 Tax=Amycolatopsis rhizosphaerae TaxID=2053003 RepID=A0A558BES4_9PSEU|nr:DNA-3-methyladenine glycosylase [Amycolatopsis rhizosphaerae]TVT35013.1 DNA-3-methyladenine glycosylase 2 family protein [Amycolatopsis rhizosphaerae]